MSEESLAVVLEVFDAWNAGDMERVGVLCDPDAIVLAPPGWPEPGPFVGREAIMRQFTQLRESFDSDTMEQVGEFQTAGDRVLVRLAWNAAGHGPALRIEWTFVYTVRNGHICGLEYFPDHHEALGAVGLSD